MAAFHDVLEVREVVVERGCRIIKPAPSPREEALPEMDFWLRICEQY